MYVVSVYTSKDVLLLCWHLVFKRSCVHFKLFVKPLHCLRYCLLDARLWSICLVELHFHLWHSCGFQVVLIYYGKHMHKRCCRCLWSFKPIHFTFGSGGAVSGSSTHTLLVHQLISHTLTQLEVRVSELNELVLITNVFMCSEKWG